MRTSLSKAYLSASPEVIFRFISKSETFSKLAESPPDSMEYRGVIFQQLTQTIAAHTYRSQVCIIYPFQKDILGSDYVE